MRYRPRYITPVTFDQYQTSNRVEDYAQVTDYYITDIGEPENWKDLRSLKGCRVFCPLNSYNIPRNRTLCGDLSELGGLDPAACGEFNILSLQGAGDVLMLTSLARKLSSLTPFSWIVVYTYDKFKNLIDNNPDIDRVVRYGNKYPSNLLWNIVKWEIARGELVNTHWPAIGRSLFFRLLDAGWDHYDWFSMTCGVPNIPKKAYLTVEDADLKVADRALAEVKGKPLIGIHFADSRGDRMVKELLYLPELVPNTEAVYVILGGSESSGVSGRTVLNLAGKLTYRESAAVISKLDCTVAVDSVVLHMASTLNTPVLGVHRLFRSTWTGPIGKRTELVDWTGENTMTEVVKWVRKQTEGRLKTG